MGRLTDDMMRLCGEIEALRSRREAFGNDLANYVSRMKANVAEMQTGFHHARAKMAGETNSRLRACTSGLKQAVADLNKEAARRQAGFREAHAETARQSAEERTAFVNELKAGVVGLKTNVAEMLVGFGDARASRCNEIKSDLSSFALEVKRSVSDLKAAIADFRRECTADLLGVRMAWAGQPSFRTGDVAEAGLMATEEKTSEHKKNESHAVNDQSEEKVPEDLTHIQGIGTGLRDRLNEAGIYTVAELARSTPEEVSQALGKFSRFADVESWIEQARQLEQ
ncbi:MAG: hypothetical protein ACLFVT_04550 [Syntrophobacteria bacterium]